SDLGDVDRVEAGVELFDDEATLRVGFQGSRGIGFALRERDPRVWKWPVGMLILDDDGQGAGCFRCVRVQWKANQVRRKSQPQRVSGVPTHIALPPGMGRLASRSSSRLARQMSPKGRQTGATVSSGMRALDTHRRWRALPTSGTASPRQTGSGSHSGLADPSGPALD